MNPGSLRRALPFLLLAALTIATYHQAPGLGLQDEWDDRLALFGRGEVRDWGAASWGDRLRTPALGYPAPLPSAVQAVLASLPPARAVAVAHVLNVALHVVNAWLAFALLARWVGRGRALAGAALWAVHPVLVESVAWIANLKRLIAATCLLAGALTWERFLVRRRARAAVDTGLLAVLGLACHPAAASLVPFAWARALATRPVPRRALAGLAIPPVLYVAAFAPGYAQFLRAANDPDTVEEAGSRRFALAAGALGVQLEHLLVPASLHPVYSTHGPRAAWHRALGGAFVAAMAAAMVISWRRRAAATPGLLLWWAAYLPSSGLTPLPRFAADAFVYLPALGLVAAALAIRPRSRVPHAAAALATIAVLVLAVRSSAQTRRWLDAETLWSPVMAAVPGNARAYLILAEARAARGDFAGAAEVLDRGNDALRATGMTDRRVAEIYRRGGNPLKAADVLLGLLVRGDRDPATGVLLLDVLSEHGIPLPASGTARDAVRRAAAHAATPGSAAPETRVRIARYLAGQGEAQAAEALDAAAGGPSTTGTIPGEGRPGVSP